MIDLQSFLSHMSDLVFDTDPSMQTLLTIIMYLSVFWFLLLGGLSHIVSKLTYGKPWLVAALERDYDHGGKELWDMLGLPLSKKEFVETNMDWAWSENLLMFIQHGVGGALALPSLLNLCSSSSTIIARSSTCASLACLGILSEIAWEVESLLVCIFRQIFQTKKKPGVVLIVTLLVHHSLATGLGIPFILFYRDNKVLHRLNFDLQAAAAVAYVVGEYTKLLDVTKARELLQFQVLTVFGFFVMLFTRGIDWFYILYQIGVMLVNEKRWVIFGAFFIIGLLFTAFNVFFCILPFYKRCVKFLKKSAEHKSLLSTISDEDSDSNKEMLRVSLNELAVSAHLSALQLSLTPRDVLLTESLRLSQSKARWAKVKGAATVVGKLKVAQRKQNETKAFTGKDE